MKRLLIILIWLPVTITTLFVALALQNFRYNLSLAENLDSWNVFTNNQYTSNSYQLYSSLPKVLGATTVAITSQDAIPELIKEYLEKQNSPMAPYTNDLIKAARKYNLDPLLLVAIAQCESNLGKKMPPGCNNPFGWGIHSKGTLCFDTWQAGFQTVAKGLRDKYFNTGLDSPEELMARYTPPALEKDGSWAKCVNYFLENLETAK